MLVALALLAGVALADEPPTAERDATAEVQHTTHQLTLVAPTRHVLYTHDDFIEAMGQKARTRRSFPRLGDASAPRDMDRLLRFVPGTTGLDTTLSFQGAPTHEVHLHLDGAEVLVPPGWQGLR